MIKADCEARELEKACLLTIDQNRESENRVGGLEVEKSCPGTVKRKGADLATHSLSVPSATIPLLIGSTEFHIFFKEKILPCKGWKNQIVFKWDMTLKKSEKYF